MKIRQFRAVATVLGMTWGGLCLSAAPLRLFVAPTGSDECSGAAEEPLLTIAAAIAKAQSDGDGTVIVVSPGRYLATNTVAAADGTVYALSLDKPNVSIVSSRGPAETTIDAGTDLARAEALIDAEGAFVGGFTFVNGKWKKSSVRPALSRRGALSRIA